MTGSGQSAPGPILLKKSACQSEAEFPSNSLTPLGILVQISNLQMINGMNEKIKRTDIYIKPDVQKYSVISFDKGKEIIKKGEEASFIVYEDLKKLVVKDNKDII